MFFTNKQWLWRNWVSLNIFLCFILCVPLILMMLLKITGALQMLAVALVVIAIVIFVYSILAFDKITNSFKNDLINSEFVNLLYSGDLKRIVELKLTKLDFELPLPDGICPISIATVGGNKELVSFLLKNGTKRSLSGALREHPIQLAAKLGHLEITRILLEHFNQHETDYQDKLTCTPFMLNCFFGNVEKVLQSSREFLALEKDSNNLTALHYALLGAANELVVLHLLKLKSSINSIGTVINIDDFKNRKLSEKKVIPIHMAFEKLPNEVIIEMLKCEKTYAKDSRGVSVLMRASKKGAIDIIELIKDNVDFFEKDTSNLDALDYCKLAKQVEAEKVVRRYLELAERKQNEIMAKKRSNDIALGGKVDDNANSNKNVKIFQEDIKLMLQTSLRGMVNMGQFIDNFSHELEAFFKKGFVSKGIVLWGNSSVGKTELSKRLCNSAGQKDSYASFDLPGIDFKYVACCDQSIDVKKIIESIDKKTVLFLDEIDKYLSPSSGVVSESQAKGLRTSLITNFESKEIYWVFVGTFADIRGERKLSIDTLEETLGRELASRLDFADWMLSDWSVSSLLEAFNGVVYDEKQIDYHQDAILKLSNYILERRSGVRGLQKAHEAIKRSYREIISSGKDVIVTALDIDKYITKETQS